MGDVKPARLEFDGSYQVFLPIENVLEVRKDRFGHEWRITEDPDLPEETIAVCPRFFKAAIPERAWYWCTLMKLTPRRHSYSVILPWGYKMAQCNHLMFDIFGWRLETRGRISSQFSVEIPVKSYFGGRDYWRPLIERVAFAMRHRSRDDYDWMMVRDCARYAVMHAPRCIQCSKVVTENWRKVLSHKEEEAYRKKQHRLCSGAVNPRGRLSWRLQEAAFCMDRNTCSQRCWHRLVNRVIREEIEICHEKQVVESVRSLMANVKTALRKRDPDALRSLKEEFDLLASSRK